MFQVKCFQSDDEKDLEDDINDFLATNAHNELIDIKYSHSIAVEERIPDEDGEYDPDEEPEVQYSFTAMVVYQKIKYK
ncbi:sporulation protein Cse60 [Niallia taxi]|uniref:sporulation protein Cse60 n=1 Tax=Niallia taxi TaxID=2499688 RepID=UPI0015F53871|nr:sporulation protein Cse60 [Niallia taxi]